jgi:hypothetical protein
MMMLSVLTAAIILFTPLHVSGGSQAGPPQTFGAQQRTPPRDPALEKKGTGIIRGKVVNADGEVKQIELIMKSPGSQ